MNKSSLLISILGLALVAAAAILWLSGDDGDLPAPPPTSSSTVEVLSEVESSAVEAAFAEEDPDEVVADDDGEAANEREEVVIEIDESPRLEIQVWQRRRGKVAPEAEVFVLEGYDRPDPFDQFGPHRCELALVKGKKYRASTEGRVSVPRLKKDAIIAARLEGSVGVTRVRPQESRSDVVLLPDETVTVRVIGASGRPVADVPVGLQQRLVSRIEAKSLTRNWDQVSNQLEEMRKRLAADPSQAGVRRRVADLTRRRKALLEQWTKFKEASASKGKGSQKDKGKQKGKGNKKVAKSPAKKSKPKGKAKTDPLVETRMEVRARRRTDDKGLAVFRHFQFYRQRAAGWWPKQHRDRFDAVLMVPLAKSVRASFQGQPVPEDIIELRMPPTGSVALRTVDYDGRPFTHPVHGELRMIDAKNPRWMRVPIRKQQNEREIVFPFVGLGVELLANCRLDDNDFRWQSPQFDGPQRAGERVAVDLVVAPDEAMFYGRVLSPAGVPLMNAKTTFLINSMRGRLEGEEVLLDDEGRFHLPFNVGVVERHQAPYRFQVRHLNQLPVPGLAQTLGVLPKQGIVDLGDLQLGMLPPICSGKVVDDLGQPIAGARVQLQRERQLGGRRPRQEWQDEAFTDVRADEAGSFWLYGDLEAARYRLRVTASGYFPYDQPNLPGREGVVIKLPRRSRVVGSVLLPEWLPARSVKVQLLAHNDPTKNREDRIRDYRGRKLIYFDWVKAGIYSLTFRMDGFPDPFARVDNFELRAGEQGEHPRLTNIDLGRDLYRFEVRAVREDGKRFTPKSPLRARVLRPSGQYAMLGFSWRGGKAQIVSTQSTLEVWPESRGYRAEHTTLVAGASQIMFTRAPPLSLRAPGMRQLVGEQPVWISLEPIAGPKVLEFDSGSRRTSRSVRRLSTTHGDLRRNDVARLTPVRDGRYRVLARLGNKARGGLVSVALGEVDVRTQPGGAPQVLTVSVNAQAINMALQEVEQRAAAAAAKPARSRK